MSRCVVIGLDPVPKLQLLVAQQLPARPALPPASCIDSGFRSVQKSPWMLTKQKAGLQRQPEHVARAHLR